MLVTGGSKGLGEVICRKFAQEGCHVAINYSADTAAAEKLAEELKQFGGKVICIKAVSERQVLVLSAECHAEDPSRFIRMQATSQTVPAASQKPSQHSAASTF